MNSLEPQRQWRIVVFSPRELESTKLVHDFLKRPELTPVNSDDVEAILTGPIPTKCKYRIVLVGIVYGGFGGMLSEQSSYVDVERGSSVMYVVETDLIPRLLLLEEFSNTMTLLDDSKTGLFPPTLTMYIKDRLAIRVIASCDVQWGFSRLSRLIMTRLVHMADVAWTLARRDHHAASSDPLCEKQLAMRCVTAFEIALDVMLNRTMGPVLPSDPRLASVGAPRASTINCDVGRLLLYHHFPSRDSQYFPLPAERSIDLLQCEVHPLEKFAACLTDPTYSAHPELYPYVVVTAPGVLVAERHEEDEEEDLLHWAVCTQAVYTLEVSLVPLVTELAKVFGLKSAALPAFPVSDQAKLAVCADILHVGSSAIGGTTFLFSVVADMPALELSAISSLAIPLVSRILRLGIRLQMLVTAQRAGIVNLGTVAALHGITPRSVLVTALTPEEMTQWTATVPGAMKKTAATKPASQGLPVIGSPNVKLFLDIVRTLCTSAVTPETVTALTLMGSFAIYEQVQATRSYVIMHEALAAPAVVPVVAPAPSDAASSIPVIPSPPPPLKFEAFAPGRLSTCSVPPDTWTTSLSCALAHHARSAFAPKLKNASVRFKALRYMNTTSMTVRQAVQGDNERVQKYRSEMAETLGMKYHASLVPLVQRDAMTYLLDYADRVLRRVRYQEADVTPPRHDRDISNDDLFLRIQECNSSKSNPGYVVDTTTLTCRPRLDFQYLAATFDPIAAEALSCGFGMAPRSSIPHDDGKSVEPIKRKPGINVVLSQNPPNDSEAAVERHEDDDDDDDKHCDTASTPSDPKPSEPAKKKPEDEEEEELADYNPPEYGDDGTSQSHEAEASAPTNGDSATEEEAEEAAAPAVAAAATDNEEDPSLQVVVRRKRDRADSRSKKPSSRKGTPLKSRARKTLDFGDAPQFAVILSNAAEPSNDDKKKKTSVAVVTKAQKRKNASEGNPAGLTKFPVLDAQDTRRSRPPATFPRRTFAPPDAEVALTAGQPAPPPPKTKTAGKPMVEPDDLFLQQVDGADDSVSTEHSSSSSSSSSQKRTVIEPNAKPKDTATHSRSGGQKRYDGDRRNRNSNRQSSDDASVAKERSRSRDKRKKRSRSREKERSLSRSDNDAPRRRGRSRSRETRETESSRDDDTRSPQPDQQQQSWYSNRGSRGKGHWQGGGGGGGYKGRNDWGNYARPPPFFSGFPPLPPPPRDLETVAIVKQLQSAVAIQQDKVNELIDLVKAANSSSSKQSSARDS